MTIQKLPGVDPQAIAARTTTRTLQELERTTESAPETGQTQAQTGTGVHALEPKEVAADPTWIASQTSGQASRPIAGKSVLSVRFPEMSPKLTFNDNLAIALAKCNGHLGSDAPRITPAVALALFEVTKSSGISPKELKDAARITADFASRGDANASILQELTAKIRASYADQGFVTKLLARTGDIGKRDQLPSLTAQALAATQPGKVGEWVDAHFAKARDAAPAEKIDGPAPNAATGKYIMCPVLGSLIQEGSLKQDEKGNISLGEFNELMINRLGITPERAAVTVSTGFIGNHASDAPAIAAGKFNINHLKGSILDHQHHGDTGILADGDFHEDKFQALCAHSSDGKTLCIADFAQAINDQLKRDDGFVTRVKGTGEDIFEMAALINTFGYVDDKGERRIDFQTMRDLYQHRKLPSKEELMARKPTGVLEHTETMAKMTEEMLKDAVNGRGERK